MRDRLTALLDYHERGLILVGRDERDNGAWAPEAVAVRAGRTTVKSSVQTFAQKKVIV